MESTLLRQKVSAGSVSSDRLDGVYSIDTHEAPHAQSNFMMRRDEAEYAVACHLGHGSLAQFDLSQRQREQ